MRQVKNKPTASSLRKQIALEALEYMKANNLSAKEVSKVFDIPYSSMKRYAAKKIDFNNYTGGRYTKLSIGEEDQLLNWCEEESDRGLVIQPYIVKRKAKEIFGKKDFVASDGWWKVFLSLSYFFLNFKNKFEHQIVIPKETPRETCQKTSPKIRIKTRKSLK